MTKNRVEDLAVCGGAPAFADKLHVGRPNVGDRKKFSERVDDILDCKWLTNEGYYVGEFERRIAEIAGVEHCVAMCNATVGLEIVIRALGLTGEVIVPSFTFIATAHALQWQDITPVFCDIDPRTHTLDPIKVEQLITPLTTAIMGVHLWGRACEIDPLAEIASRHGLKLLFDSAHAFGCSYKGQTIGGFGHAEVFSFHATKFVNSLEGGAVVTHDGELAKRMRLMKNFGFTNYDHTDSIGTNGKLNEVSAAMGLTNLESMDDFITVNRSNYERYEQELFGLEGVSLLRYDSQEQCNYQYVVLEIESRKTALTRDQLMGVLHAENVLARRYFYPGCHRMKPYGSEARAEELPETDKVAMRVLCLPTGTAVSQADITQVCQILRLAIENAEAVRRLTSVSNDSFVLPNASADNSA